MIFLAIIKPVNLGLGREPDSCSSDQRIAIVCLMKMKFLDWYVKIGVASALVGASMEFFMVKTGFYDKVTVLESEKRALENSPEAQAIREALNPWRHVDTKETNKTDITLPTTRGVASS
ncbi:hypothetical protein P8452_08100 [Trifolium repens]|nr:hypothetical protein P8452_08100 [Trifolium repens]